MNRSTILRTTAAVIVAVVLALVAVFVQTVTPAPADPGAGRALGRASAPLEAGRAAISLGRASAGRAAIGLESVMPSAAGGRAAGVMPAATQGHDAYARKYGFANWRAFCPDNHGSTGGSWRGPRHWTKAGAELDASRHFFGYND